MPLLIYCREANNNVAAGISVLHESVLTHCQRIVTTCLLSPRLPFAVHGSPGPGQGKERLRRVHFP